MIATKGGAECGAVDARLEVSDADLAELIDQWESLSLEVRAKILALVRAG